MRYADVLPIALHQHVLDYVLSRREGGRFETGLVYAFKRDTVERLAEILKDGGVPALPYHGGMPTAARRRTQEAFERGETPVVVASTAFGMGIDVAGIRYVVHHSMPKSIEAFYQESGRAGRDGRACDSVLYYSEKDVELYTFLNSRDENVEKSVAQARADRLQKMKDYCMKVRCRRLTLLEYFGEKASAKEVCGKGCDVCSARDDVRARMRVHVPTQRGLDKKRKTGTEFQTARSLLKRVLEVKGDEAKARKRKTSAKDDIEAYSDTENNIKVTGDIGLVGVTKRRKGSLRRVDFRRYAPSNL